MLCSAVAVHSQETSPQPASLARMGGPETWWTHRGIRRYGHAPEPSQYRKQLPRAKTLAEMRDEVLEASTKARLQTTNLQSTINVGLTGPLPSNYPSVVPGQRRAVKTGLDVKAALIGLPPRWEEFQQSNSSANLEADLFTANSLKVYLSHSPSRESLRSPSHPTLYKIPSLSGIITYESAPFRPQTSSSIYGSHYQLPPMPNAVGQHLRQPLHMATGVGHNRYANA